MKENAIESKSFAFAKVVVSTCRRLIAEEKEFVLSRQLLKSGTSIGANVAEAQRAQSMADFVSKMSIAQKEAYETDYWLRLLHETGYLESNEFEVLYQKIDEIQRILTSICKSSAEKD